MEISGTFTVIRVTRDSETGKVESFLAVPAEKQKYSYSHHPEKIDCGDIEIRQEQSYKTGEDD